MVTMLEHVFPRLRLGSYQITSPVSQHCNCIGWAADDQDRWWWPVSAGNQFYWPSGIPCEETLAAFEAAFATLRYLPCDGDGIEVGCEKVAIFVDSQGKPTHAARQLANGRWTSKLGEREDIAHDLRDLEGDIYGTVARIMKRAKKD